MGLTVIKKSTTEITQMALRAIRKESGDKYEPYWTVGKRVRKLDRFISFWNKREIPISYIDGDQPCYYTKKKYIELPSRSNHYSNEEFYNSALHEIAHSCIGLMHPDRYQSTNMESQEYLINECIVEFSVLLLYQAICKNMSLEILSNSANYIKCWATYKDAPRNVIDIALHEAQKIVEFVMNERKHRGRTSK